MTAKIFSSIFLAYLLLTTFYEKKEISNNSTNDLPFDRFSTASRS